MHCALAYQTLARIERVRNFKRKLNFVILKRILTFTKEVELGILEEKGDFSFKKERKIAFLGKLHFYIPGMKKRIIITKITAIFADSVILLAGVSFFPYLLMIERMSR